MRSAGIRLLYNGLNPLPEGVKAGILLEAGFGTYLSQGGYSERPGNTTKNLVRAQEASQQVFDRATGNRIPACTGNPTDCLTVGGNLKYRSSKWPTGAA